MNKNNKQKPPRKQSIIITYLYYIYAIGLICLAIYTFLNPILQPYTLYQINRETHDILHSLIKTKYFRMIRINLNSQCQLYARNRICNSKSCTVCRCDYKDIPSQWFKQSTDKVQKQIGGRIDIWEQQRQLSLNNNSFNWVWHVEDYENDQGEYFDLDVNIQSFSNYNGSTIWKMVYEENCFQNKKLYGKNQSICKQEQVFYKVISGLHTSISSHLSRFYKSISKQTQKWADLKSSDQLFFNKEQYQRRVLDYPQRIENLLFIYQIYLRAIKQISPYMLQNYTINSQNIIQDFQASKLLNQLSKKFQSYSFQPFDQQLKTFFYPQNPKVLLYQHLIHNISRLMNCVQCQKCRLFGKMQTYGMGTALKILLGYNNFYKRNQMVALYNAWNKISMSVDLYYQTIGRPQDYKQQYVYDIFWLRLYGFIMGSFVLFISILSKFDLKQKIKKMFQRVRFPAQRQMGGYVPSAKHPVSVKQKQN